MTAAAGRRAAQVVAVRRLGPVEAGLGQIDLYGPGLAAGVRMGRFAMLEAPGRSDCILRRPFSYFAAAGADHVSFLVKDMGAGSRGLLAARPGDPLTVLGPFGNGFGTPTGEIWGVAGGVGAAPFGLLAGPRRQVLLGARSADDSGFGFALQDLGIAVSLATDDGSAGFAGSVVALLEVRLKTSRPVALQICGPTGMMAAVAAVARRHRIPCEASLEERMGCGFGVCRGCAHRDAAGAWRCICVDGPVYDTDVIFAPAAPT